MHGLKRNFFHIYDAYPYAIFTMPIKKWPKFSIYVILTLKGPEYVMSYTSCITTKMYINFNKKGQKGQFHVTYPIRGKYAMGTAPPP